jgi:hypothetical protein
MIATQLPRGGLRADAAKSRDVSDAIVVEAGELFGEDVDEIHFERPEHMKRLDAEAGGAETAIGGSWCIVGILLLAGSFRHFAC